MTDEFLPNPKLKAENDASKHFICTQCGECCHIREKKNITEKEEESYTRFMYRRYGIIYLARLNDITINVWPEEYELLSKEAEKRKLKLVMKPKRAVYNEQAKELLIIDYFIDHDICPFYDKKTKQCTVYDIRPLICQSYPLLTTKNLGKCKYKKSNPEDYLDEKPRALMLEHKTIALKKLLSQMINDGTIINKPLSEDELKRLLGNAVIKNIVLKIKEE